MKATSTSSLSLIAIMVLLFVACKDDDPAPAQLLVNGSLDESATLNQWWNYSPNGHLKMSVSTQTYFSATNALKISCDESKDENWSYWGQTMTAIIPHGKNITLKAKIKGNLTGIGAGIAIAGDTSSPSDGNAEQFSTTQGQTPITGTFDWQDYSVTLLNINSNIKTITIFLLVLPNTTGEVYFDDLSLTESE